MEIFFQIANDPRIVLSVMFIIGSLIRYAIYKLKKVEFNQGLLFEEHKKINRQLTVLQTEHNLYCHKCKPIKKV